MSNLRTYIQYTNSIRMKTLLNSLVNDSWLDFEKIFLLYFNLFTCNNWGLQWWGSRNMLNMQQYIVIARPYKNITPQDNPKVDTTTAYWQRYKTPTTFNYGNLYNGQQALEYFSDEEYRTILINKYKQTFYACTLGNLLFFLNNFFALSPNDDIKKQIKFTIEVQRRGGDNPITSFWYINYTGKFDADPTKNKAWETLFRDKDDDGNSVIMPIPNDVDWLFDKKI